MSPDWKLKFSERILREFERLKSPDSDKRQLACKQLWGQLLENEDLPPDLPPVLSELAGRSLMGNVIALGVWYASSNRNPDNLTLKTLYSNTQDRIVTRWYKKPFNAWQGRGTPEANVIAYCKKVAYRELMKLWEEESDNISTRTDEIQALEKAIRSITGSSVEDQKLRRLLHNYLHLVKEAGLELTDFDALSKYSGISAERFRQVYEEVIIPRLVEQREDLAQLASVMVRKPSHPKSKILRHSLVERIREIGSERRGKRSVLIEAIADNVGAGCAPFDYDCLEFHLEERDVSFPSSDDNPRGALHKAAHDARQILQEELSEEWWEILHELDKQLDEWQELSKNELGRSSEEEQ